MREGVTQIEKYRRGQRGGVCVRKKERERQTKMTGRNKSLEWERIKREGRW